MCRSTPGSVCSEENPAVKLTVSSNPIGDSKENLEFNLDGIGLRLVLVGPCQQQCEGIHVYEKTNPLTAPENRPVNHAVCLSS